MKASRAIRERSVCRLLAGALVLLLPMIAQPTGVLADEPIVLPPVNIVAASPLLGAGIDRNKAPAATNVLNSEDIARGGQPDALGALDQQVTGIALDDPEGNSVQPDLVYRGFSA